MIIQDWESEYLSKAQGTFDWKERILTKVPPKSLAGAALKMYPISSGLMIRKYSNSLTPKTETIKNKSIYWASR